MLLTSAQRQFLEQGLLGTTTNEDKWKVILAIIIPHIIGQELYQDALNYNNIPPTPSISKQKIQGVYMWEGGVVFFQDKTYDRVKGFSIRTYPQASFSLQYEYNRPLLGNDSLFLGPISGWGPEPWYIPLEVALEG